MTTTILCAVHNGAGFLRHMLDSFRRQTVRPDAVVIYNNASDDESARIITEEYPEVRYIRGPKNLGFWPAIETMLPDVTTDLVVCATDVILHEEFIKHAAPYFRHRPTLGALEPAVFQMNLYGRPTPELLSTIDTLGFSIERSRRIVNDGHGLPVGQCDMRTRLIFAVEGAVPVFRTEALRAARMDGWLVDPDFRHGTALGYGDDLDIPWRMQLWGWDQILAPDVIAWHDRSTTRGIARPGSSGIRQRRARRAAIPPLKRQLDWMNTRLAIVKNEYMINILWDLPWILAREFVGIGFLLATEPATLKALPWFLRLLPRMLRRRRTVLANARRTPAEMRAFILRHES